MSLKIQTEFREINCKSLLQTVKVPYLPFRWMINPYRGCQHNCWYCNARYTHEYLQVNADEFQHIVFVKSNAAEILDVELSRKKWKPALVNLGAVTDPYQPAERKFEISRKILEVFLKHRNPVVITTKSHLILRDLDLLKELSTVAFVNVAFTVITADDALRRKLEPTTSTIIKRFDAIRKLSEAGITVGVFMTPVIPKLTDSPEHILSVAQAGAEARAAYFIVDVLNMRGSTRRYFLPFLEREYPDLAEHYNQFYLKDFAPYAYAKSIRGLGLEIAQKLGLDQYDRMRYDAPPLPSEPRQLKLWET